MAKGSGNGSIVQLEKDKPQARPTHWKIPSEGKELPRHVNRGQRTLREFHNQLDHGNLVR